MTLSGIRSYNNTKLRKPRQLNRALILLLICAAGYAVYYFTNNQSSPEMNVVQTGGSLNPDIQLKQLNNILKRF